MYQKQPKFLSTETTATIIEKVREHCVKHKLTSFDFIFHGGEPLLAEKSFFINFVSQAKKALEPFTNPHFFLQTNGVLIDDEWCEIFERNHISLGISLDGTKNANDKFRLDFKKKSSYEKTIRGIRKALSKPNVSKKMGVLSVIDISTNPIENYKHFKDLGIRNFNFLLPIGNHVIPPDGITPTEIKRKTVYAEWLIEIFDAWVNDSSLAKPQIRIFNQIIELLLGIDNGFEVLGLRQTEILTIETDGAVEVDSAVRVFGAKGLQNFNIHQNSIDEVLGSELAVYFGNSHQNLHKQCTTCPILQICGGGYILNRFNEENQYKNPSVYCQDLMHLVVHIHNSLVINSESYAQTNQQQRFEELRDYVYQTN